jgi:hypothetical protein
MQRSPLEYLVHGVARPVQRESGEAQVSRCDGAHAARLSSSWPVSNMSMV